jgi:ATP-dependent 26S proteasome regulatory subunit
MATNRVPLAHVSVSVACRHRDVADRFFAELERRRRDLSIYRGKVIDPTLSNGLVYAIGFRAVKKVREQDLVLPEEVKSLIERSIVGFYSHGEVLQELGVEMKRGVLLHGPPGTGKTSISLYLAGLLPHFTVCFVSGERLLHPREICQMARYLQPAMLVFEDIDLIALEREANGLATVLGELMNQIDGCDPTEQVLFVMNTNSLDRLESAVRNRPGRVDQIIEVPLPDREARRQLLTAFARNVHLEGDLERVLDATVDMSPATLKEIVKRSVVMAVERASRCGSPTDRRAALAVQADDLLLATHQVQVKRDPIAPPGSLGFHPVRAAGGDNHEPRA